MTCFARATSVAVVLYLSTALLVSGGQAQADVPGLQIAPLEYQDTLRPNIVENGYIDVSNPGDSTVDISSDVKGFAQIDSQGSLRFFDDTDLANAITVGLPNFTLGPREAVRVGFSVDPAKLPQGGIYAAIFFRTEPPGQTSSSSYISESANVGTILALTNGNYTRHYGMISKTRVPFWQFGTGIAGSLDYRNTDRSSHPVGFKPALSAQVLPWDNTPKLTTGLVLPNATRTFAFTRTGAFFGLLPIIIRDSDTHTLSIAWVFACTGWYGNATLIFGTMLSIFVLLRLLSHRPLIPVALKKLFRRREKKTKLNRVFIDGLGPKSD
jgi:hypothetical protein